jgi:hypothetical protein
MSSLFFLLAGIFSSMIPPSEPPVAIDADLACQRKSAVWQRHYSDLNHYIPEPTDAIITIHCNLIIWQNDEGTTNFQDTPEQRERLYQLFHHPTKGLNFQFYERFNPPSDPIIPAEEEVHHKKIRFQLDSICFIRDSKMARSIGISDKRQYLKTKGYKQLLKQVNINITTSPGPVAGAWGHAEYPTYGNRIPMITTTDNPNQKPYKGTPTKEDPSYPVSIATFDGEEYYRDWSFMEHIAHELGHCLDLKHVYAGRVALGYESCNTADKEYMDDVFPVDAPWCEKPRGECDVCLQYSSKSIDVKADPADGYTNNLMNGQGGRYLSPKQLGKIHRAIATKSIGRAATGFSRTPLIIDSNQVWDFQMQLFQPIRVKKGATLTIKCVLHMPPQGFIRVDKGAQVVVDGGVIRSNDPENPTNWQAFRLRRAKNWKERIKVINGGEVALPIVLLED